LITIALIAALFAVIFVNQKFIKRKEHKPTPSQPKNKTIKLSAATRTSMKNVNRDKYDKNRI
jgi:hypothetical protein